MNNFVLFEGHLTNDPVVRTGNDGKVYATGTIGVYQGKDKSGNDLPSLFIGFICFGRDADVIGQQAKKGDLIQINGTFTETTNVGNDGKTYVNKNVRGHAKLCAKANTQNNQQVAPQQAQYAQQMPQQPQYAQQAAPQQSTYAYNAYTQPTQVAQNNNQNPWG